MDKAPSSGNNEAEVKKNETGHDFMTMPDGTVVDITDMTPEELNDLKEDARSGLK